MLKHKNGPRSVNKQKEGTGRKVRRGEGRKGADDNQIDSPQNHIIDAHPKFYQ